MEIWGNRHFFIEGNFPFLFGVRDLDRESFCWGVVFRFLERVEDDFGDREVDLTNRGLALSNRTIIDIT